jgi:hypothetical protein
MILMRTPAKQRVAGQRGETRGADGSVWVRERVFRNTPTGPGQAPFTQSAERERGEAGSSGGSGEVWGFSVGYTGYCTRIGYHLSIAIIVYCMVIRTVEADSNGSGGSCGDGGSWAGSDGFATAVEMCGKLQMVRQESGLDIISGYTDEEVRTLVREAMPIVFLTALFVTEFLGYQAEYQTALATFDAASPGPERSSSSQCWYLRWSPEHSIVQSGLEAGRNPRVR